MQKYFKLKGSCEFYPYDSGQDKKEFIIRTPDNRQFKISALAKDILLRLDGRTTLEEIVLDLEARSVFISVDGLRHLVETQYGTLGIFENLNSQSDDQPYRVRIKKSPIPFLLHWDLIPERYVVWVSKWLRFLFNGPAVTPGLLLIIITHYLVYAEYSTSQFLSHASFLWVLLLCLLSVLCHEFGHSSAVSKYGGSPGKIGFGLYILLPAFYADVSEIWRFRRKHRMVVDLGGVYFQELTFVAFALLGFLTSAPEYFVACRFIDLMILLTLNPVFQFDGYWFLVDYLALPNLYRLTLSYIRHWVSKIFTHSDKSHILPPMRRHIYLIFFAYTILSNLFLGIIIWMSYRYLYATFTQFPTILLAIYNSMIFAFKTQDLALFFNRLVTLFFLIAFPGTALLGLCRYAVNMVRYCVAKIQASSLSQNA